MLKKMYLLYALAMLGCLASSSVCLADTPALVLSCCSFHSAKANDAGVSLRDSTPGVGMELGFIKGWSAGAYKNSLGEPSGYVGALRRLRLWNQVYLSGWVGLMYYGTNEGSEVFPAALPALTFGGHQMALNLSYVPPVQYNGSRIVSAINAQFRFALN